MRAPEIHNDIFADDLLKCIQKFKLRTVLDVGASDGQGSTSEFAKTDCKIYCLETAPEPLEALKKRFKDNKKIIINDYPASSKVMTVEQVWRLYRRFPTWDCWLTVGIFEMVKWRQNTQTQIEQAKIKDGIQEIKRKYKIKNFGLALLDGGEFTGEGELEDVWGAKVIALDDIKGCKNFDNHKRLSKSDYKMYSYEPDHRNGYSIFVK